MSGDDDRVGVIKGHLARVMRGFQPSPEDDPGFAMNFGRPHRRFEVDQKRLPLPSIVRVVLIYLGFYDLGRGEKLAWEHTFKVDGVACSIASQKFGLRLYIDGVAVSEEEAKALHERIVRSLEAGQRIIERDVFRPISVELIAQGQVTIRNQYGALRNAYNYFREGARLAYAGEGRLSEQHPDGGWWLDHKRQEGWWNTFAMVTSYFSLLEHVLVGCLAFAGFDPQGSGVFGNCPVLS